MADVGGPGSLAEACDALYSMVPAEFTAARDAHVALAREAGDRSLAAAIGALRKPTLSAWLTNLLLRTQPDEVEQLLELGVALRDAQARLSGDDLRRLQAERRAVVQTLVRGARRAAAQAGHPVTEGVAWDVEATLTLALGDDAVAAAIRTGCLVGTARRETADAGDVTSALDVAAARQAPTRQPSRAGKDARPAAERPAPAGRRRSRAAAADRTAEVVADDRADDDLARRRLDRARAALADAVAARQDAERGLAQAEAEHVEAVVAVDDAAHDEQVAARRVHAAAAEAERLEQRLAAARVDVDDAERTLAQARTARVEADEAAARLDAARQAAARARDGAAAVEDEARGALADAAGGEARR